MNRRFFVASMCLLLVAALGLATIQPTHAKTPAERAVEAINRMNVEGTTVRIFGEDLSIRGALVVEEQFEQETGVNLKLLSAPAVQQFTKIMMDAVNQTGNYDLVYIMQPALGDAFNAGYLHPIDRYVEKYDPDMETFLAAPTAYKAAGKTVALPTDGDAHIMGYRKDLLNDPAEKRAFKREYGYELSVPETWEQFHDVTEFFTRPDENLYGAAWWRKKGYNYWWFSQRLYSLGGEYFDDEMNPAINSEKGVRALRDMVKLNENMPKGALGYGFVESSKAFNSGRTFSMISWPVFGRLAQDPENSEIAGKVGYAVVPGYEVDGEVNHRAMNGPGMALSVTNNSDRPRLAYLVAQYITSPENLKKAFLDQHGNTDPMRESIYEDPDVLGMFSNADEYMQVHKRSLGPPVGVPPLAIPGFNEYMESLEAEITRAYSGDVSPREALNNVANQWNLISYKYGKSNQKKLYEQWEQAYYSE